MSSIILKNVNKVYPNNVHAVYDFNLDIKDKELIVFVGPSGCGKSTTLRMIAGLEEISSGELQIDGKLVNYLPPKDRDVAMVFQNYALYPHMSVYTNMAYGIRIRKAYRPTYEKNPELDAIQKQIKSLKKDLENVEKKIAKNGDDVSLKEKYDSIFANIQSLLKEIMDKRVAIVGRDNARISRLQKEATAMEHEKEYVTDLIDKENSLEDKDDEFIEMLNQDLNNVNKAIEEINQELEFVSNNETEILTNRKLYTYEIDYEVYHAAEILDLTRYLSRKPNALSGGQRQRVALGRAIVRKPKVFLMDEPLSNLDAKLRVQTRTEIAHIHKKVGATTIYVTHDQTEAMTLADRIVIMKDGYVQQIGDPMTCFNDPDNMFVAGFIGSPAMNFITGTYSNGYFTSENAKIALTEKYQKILSSYEGKEVVLGVRPDNLTFVRESKEDTLDVIVNSVELLGNEFILYSSFGDQKITAKITFNIEADENKIRSFALQEDKIYFFDKETSLRIR